MPWTVAKTTRCPTSKPWGVINQSSGNVDGCHPTEARARAQQKALYASERRRQQASVTGKQLTEALAAAFQRVEKKHLPALVRAYETAIREAGESAADKFALTAAAEWQPPAEGVVLTAAAVGALTARLQKNLGPIWTRVILDMVHDPLSLIEISWDVKHPVTQRLLDQAAQRTGDRLSEAVQPVLRQIIADSYEEGLAVRDAAERIMSAIGQAAPWQADMLARTDLNSLANGASLNAALESSMGFKTWEATLDDKTRPEHMAAHGQTVPINDFFLVGGEEADYPGDPNLSDAMACNCRCTLVYGEDMAEAEGLVAAGDDGQLVIGLQGESAGSSDLSSEGGGIIMSDMATTRQRAKRQHRRAAKPKKQEALVAGAVAVHHTPVVSGTWDGNAAMGRCSSAADYRSICAAFESGGDLSQRQSWHLPHHANPNGPANINGVRNALSRAPQTTSISPEDRAGATTHLRAHLNDYNKRQGNNAIEGFDELTTEEALAAMTELLGPIEDHLATDDSELQAKLPPGMNEMPAGVKHCQMNGTPGYTGGGACHMHNDSPAGMRSAMQKAQADARKGSKASLVASPRAIGITGTAAIEGKLSDDNTLTPRVLLPGGLTWPEMPRPFMAQTVTAEGHDGAEIAGRIDTFTRKKSTGKMRDINFQGELTTPHGVDEIAPMIEDQTLKYVSADLGGMELAIVNRQTFEIIPREELDIAQLNEGMYALGVTTAKIKALTLVPTQAIEGAMVSLTAAADLNGIAIDQFTVEEMFALTAAGSLTLDPERTLRVVVPASIVFGDEALTASAAEWRPPLEWFETPELPGKCPLTVLENGRVYGHLATWDSCHASFLPSCIPPPKSPSNYARFHTGEIDTEEGATVSVGKLMFSPNDGGHADRSLSASKASQYYDRTGMVAAVLRASDGKHGIWVAGALNPELTPQQRKDMRAELRLNPPSGDWRIWDGNYDLLCAIAVAVPGFPIARATVTITASADGVEMSEAIIASSGIFEPDPQALYAAERLGIADEEALAERQMRALAARAEGMDALAALAGGEK